MFDYRYSVLPLVFANRLSSGRLAQDELRGLSDDKLACIYGASAVTFEGELLKIPFHGKARRTASSLNHRELELRTQSALAMPPEKLMRWKMKVVSTPISEPFRKSQYGICPMGCPFTF
jgi:hypothetical protein